MHSSRVPADYRIQKMRAAEESSRQMNAYVKVRTHAISRAVENPTRHANATPPPAYRMLTIECPLQNYARTVSLPPGV